MATQIAWLLNFDADRELRDPALYRPGLLDAERIRALVALTADLIAADDIWLDADARDALAADAIVQAFCPTPSALQRIAQLGLKAPPAPALDVLRRVNDRGFCALLGNGLAHACFVRDMPSLERQLQAAPPGSSFVIKRAFSFAGREQRRVHDARLDASTRGFCLRSLSRGEGLQVEPWVERLADFGLHGYLTQAGELLTGVAREQRCDAMGRFLGISTQPAQLSATEQQLLRSELTKTATALTAAGYFGPFGIDAFRYREPGGALAFNARCEINARFTMGYPRALLLDGLMLG
jgi:hypothetical protein